MAPAYHGAGGDTPGEQKQHCQSVYSPVCVCMRSVVCISSPRVRVVAFYLPMNIGALVIDFV